MANRCLFVSETSDDANPLVPGEHLVLADLEGLMARCEEHLRDEVKRATIADRAYEFLKSQLPVEEGCRRMLDLAAGDTGNLPHAGQLTRFARAAVGRLRSKYFLLRSLPAAAKPFLRRQPLAHRIFYPAQSLFDRLRGKWSLQETERRRQEIVERLQRMAGHNDADRADEYEILANPRARRLPNRSGFRKRRSSRSGRTAWDRGPAVSPGTGRHDLRGPSGRLGGPSGRFRGSYALQLRFLDWSVPRQRCGIGVWRAARRIRDHRGRRRLHRRFGGTCGAIDRPAARLRVPGAQAT